MTSDSAFRDLELLAELFRSGGWREMRLQTADMSVLLSTDPAVDGLGGPYSQILLPTAATDARLFVPAHDAAMDAKKRVAPENTDPSWRVVTAPNLGTFYRSPKPGSPAFVELGQSVQIDTEICLIEVMKLFTSVKAGVAGTIRRIDATDAELVEGGQPLFHIEPE